jgi:hypothetical protein
MADFSSTGLWDAYGIMLEFDSINMSPELHKEVLDWIRFYDIVCHTRPNYSFIGDKAEILNSRGLVLAKKIKALNMDAVVAYRGETADGMLDEEIVTP